MKTQKKSFRQFIKPSELKKYFEYEMRFTDNKIKKTTLYADWVFLTVHSRPNKYNMHILDRIRGAEIESVVQNEKIGCMVATYCVTHKEIETIKFTIDWYNKQNNESIKQGKPISYPEIKLISK